MLLRHAFAAGALVAIGLARGPACGDVDEPVGGPNAPCTRSSDCSGDLACLDGVCRERERRSGDAAAGDAPDGG